MENFTLSMVPQFKRTIMAIRYSKSKIIFCFTKNENIVFELTDNLQKELIKLIDGKNSIGDIIKKLLCEKNKVFNELKKLNNLFLLEFNVKEIKENRFSRQKLFWGIFEKNGEQFSKHIEEKLKKSKVAIFGLGGFGSHLVYEMAYLGVGTLKIVDYDNVNITNLNRQILYSEKDLNQAKTDIAKKVINKINRDIKVESINKKLSSVDDIAKILKDSDMGIIAADEPRDKIFKWFNRASYLTNVPVMFSLGVNSHSAIIGPLVVPGETACFECSLPDMNMNLNDELVKHINENYQHGVIKPYISVATGIIALEVIKEITSFSEPVLYNSRLYFDFSNYTSNITKFTRKKHCEFCSGV